jgi:hypothetical protein
MRDGVPTEFPAREPPGYVATRPASAVSRRRLLESAFIVVTALLLVLASGCGGGGQAEPGSFPGRADQLLTEKDVAEYPEGSPERAFLRWWQAAQYGDFRAYLDGFARSVRRQLEGSSIAKRNLNRLSGGIRVARPEIVDVVTESDGVTLYTEITYRQPIGTSHYVTTTQPRAFSMVREQGSWRLVDDSFVEIFA